MKTRAIPARVAEAAGIAPPEARHPANAGRSLASTPVSVSGTITLVGEMLVAADGEGIVGSAAGNLDAFSEKLGIRGYEIAMDRDGGASRLAAEAIRQIEEYFSGSRRDFDIPLRFGPRSGFAREVLEEVAYRLPFGSTATYGEIGERAGRFRAARAVGNIMASCPFALLVPCHRVVHAGHPAVEAFPGESGMINRKQWLLEFEGAGLIREREAAAI